MADEINPVAKAVWDHAVALAGDNAAGALLAALNAYAPGTYLPPLRSAKLKPYLVRLVLSYDGSVEADTMPEEPPETKPDDSVDGLAQVVDYIYGIATAFHASRGDPAPDLDRDAMAKRLSSLRVSLSRSGGATWWHTGYHAGGAEWQAALRVVRG